MTDPKPLDTSTEEEIARALTLYMPPATAARAARSVLRALRRRKAVQP